MQPTAATWRHARARLDISVEEAAKRLKIAPGSLRNIESGQPRAVVSERLAWRAVALYDVPLSELVANNEGVPDLPPSQPKRPPAPPPRRTNEKKAPKRVRQETEASAGAA